MSRGKKTIKELKESGTYRKSRHGTEEESPKIKPVSKIPSAPAYLGRYGKAEYKRIADDLKQDDVLFKCDFGLLEVACNEFQTYRECSNELERFKKSANEELTFKQKLDYIKHYTKVMRDSLKSYTEIVYKLGCSPIERSKIKIDRSNRKQEEESILDVFK